MRAIILTGGQGTRLRPLTCSVPKPLLPVANRPFLRYQFDLLRRHGVRDVTLATAYRASLFRRAFGDGRRLGLRLSYSQERSPLGTGGALRHARKSFDRTVLVLNGDVLSSLDVPQFLRRHRANRAQASITLVRVKDPTQYGLVETDASGRVLRFLEKPASDEVTCSTINAGAYLLEPEAVSQIPPGIPYSLERGLFPLLLAQGRAFFGFELKGYWIDIGTLDKYLQVHGDLLRENAPFPLPGARGAGWILERGARSSPEAVLEEGGRALLGEGTRVEARARFAGSVCVGPRCVVEEGAFLKDCVVLEGCRIGRGARLEGCLLGRGCRVGPNAQAGPRTVLGDGGVLPAFSMA